MSCLFLPAHSSYDRYSLSSKNHEPHAFYRKHLWCSSTFRTKNIHISLVCFCQRTLATIYIPFRARITNRTRFIESIYGVLPRLERRMIHISLVCFCQRPLAKIDIPFRARITNRTRFIESIYGVLPRLERRIYTYLLSVSTSAL